MYIFACKMFGAHEDLFGKQLVELKKTSNPSKKVSRNLVTVSYFKIKIPIINYEKKLLFDYVAYGFVLFASRCTEF